MRKSRLLRNGANLISIAICLLASTALAQGPASTALRPYPTSPMLSTHPLPESKRAVLERLFLPQLSPSTLIARSQELCRPTISRLAPVDESTKKAVATTEVSFAAELIFERQGALTGPELATFSVIVEISKARVLLQHLSPRFPSDGSGVSVPMAHQNTRPVRLEGKFDSGILALVPPVRECGVQGVTICARSYSKDDHLLQTPYELKSVRPLVKAKADGVYAPLGGIVGKIMVGLLASPGIKLPSQSLITKTGTEILSDVLEYQTPREQRTVQPPLNFANFPVQAAFESRVDFGREEGSIRTVSKRVNVEVTSITIADLPNIEVGTSVVSVQGGQCYLLSQWSEEAV